MILEVEVKALDDDGKPLARLRQEYPIPDGKDSGGKARAQIGEDISALIKEVHEQGRLNLLYG